MTSHLISVINASAATSSSDAPIFTFGQTVSVTLMESILWAVVTIVAMVVFAGGMVWIQGKVWARRGKVQPDDDAEYAKGPGEIVALLVGGMLVVTGGFGAAIYGPWLTQKNEVESARETAFAEWVDDNYDNIDLQGVSFKALTWVKPTGNNDGAVIEVDGKPVRVRTSPQANPTNIFAQTDGSWQLMTEDGKPLPATK